MKGNLRVEVRAETALQKRLLKQKRRSKRSQVKEIFSCQCGKAYLSFSALYLHSKNKHNMKLTTKISDEVCKIEKNFGLIKYCYYVKEQGEYASEENSLDNIAKSGQESGWGKIINQKMEVTQSQPQVQYFHPFIQNLQSKEEIAIIESFLRFSLSFKASEINLHQEINDIPYFLNDFIAENFESSNCVGKSLFHKEAACKVLHNLCQWMRQTRLTDLLVIPFTQ